MMMIQNNFVRLIWITSQVFFCFHFVFILFSFCFHFVFILFSFCFHFIFILFSFCFIFHFLISFHFIISPKKLGRKFPNMENPAREKGEKRALVVGFSLPSSSYATIFFREMMKKKNEVVVALEERRK